MFFSPSFASSSQYNACQDSPQPNSQAKHKSVVNHPVNHRRKTHVTPWRKVADTSMLSTLTDHFRPEICCVEPVNAVFTEIVIANYPFRLYAIANATSQHQPNSESDSNLLLVLTPMANSYVPVGTDLTIRESDRVCAYQHRCWSTNPAYLYTLVSGHWEQQFTVEVVLPNVLPFALPTLSF